MIDYAAIEAAAERIAGLAIETPLATSRSLSMTTGASVSFKHEIFQRTGAFKIRGAANRILTLSAEARERGVITASAGNHAQGVALAGQEIGVDTTVIMPRGAAMSKISATQSYGATVRLEGTDYSAAQQAAHELATAEGLTYVHAFDDPAVIAGQGTIGIEILEALPRTDTIVVPIGGGGLISGIATAVAGSDPSVRVIGVQAAGAASVPESLKRGAIFERDSVDTIADGIATRRVADRTFDIIQERVDDVVTVSDDAIANAVTRLLDREKVMVEPAGAVGVAALLTDAFDYDEDEVIVPVLSGGNIDLNVLTTVILRGLVQTGRYAKLRTILKDRPGALEHLSSNIAALDANIYAIRHDRTSRNVAMNAAEVELELETRGEDHLQSVIAGLESAGYTITLVE